MKQNYEFPDMSQQTLSGIVPLCTSGTMEGSATIDPLSEENWELFGNN